MMWFSLLIATLPGRNLKECVFAAKKDIKLVSVLFATNNYFKSHIKEEMWKNLASMGSTKDQKKLTLFNLPFFLS